MSRLQLALAVDDVHAASAFYAALFGAEPAKHRPGYANFVLAEPPLKLVLIERPGAGGGLDHLGVEVGSTDEVGAWRGRLTERDLVATDQAETVCCYARQDKFWVQGDPDGAPWEVYTVLADAPEATDPGVQPASAVTAGTVDAAAARPTAATAGAACC